MDFNERNKQNIFGVKEIEKLTGLIIDHAAQLTNRQLDYYRMALALVWPPMRIVRKLRKINKWNTLKSAATTLP